MAAKSPARSYWRESRGLAVGYLFLVPLLALYQIGVAFDPGARNGAGYILDRVFLRFGASGVLILNLVLIALIFLALARLPKGALGRPGLYAVMFLESTAFALLLLVSGRFVYANLLSLSPFLRDIVASAGAGVYEEVLFRLLALGGLLWILREGIDLPMLIAFPSALVVSSALFSQAHHSIGGEPFVLKVFWYRAGMGAALGCIYFARGLGIAVYSHALYNVLLVLTRTLDV